MRWMTCATLGSFVLAGCSSGTPGGGGKCKSNAECGAGEVCFSDACRKVCSTDLDCGPNDCGGGGTVCTGDVCLPGCRENAPHITAIDGDGTPDGAPTHAAHHVASALLLSGEHLDGAAADLLGLGAPRPLQVQGGANGALVALLPGDTPPGSYTIRVTNAVGSDQGTVTLLQGEQGPPGPLPVVATTGGLTGDGSGVAPLAIDAAYLSARYAPLAHDHGGGLVQPATLVLPSATTAERNAIVNPAAGQVLLNTDTQALDYWDGSSWRTSASGWSIRRANVLLQGDINTHQTTPTWDLPVAGLPANTRGVIIGLRYFHGGTSDHGYLDFWAFQRGRAANTEYAALFSNTHYSDYYNSDYYELVVPWDKALGDDTLRVEVISSYNSNALNDYFIYLKGYLTAN